MRLCENAGGQKSLEDFSKPHALQTARACLSALRPAHVGAKRQPEKLLSKGQATADVFTQPRIRSDARTGGRARG
jgi:hypothetical protein